MIWHYDWHLFEESWTWWVGIILKEKYVSLHRTWNSTIRTEMRINKKKILRVRIHLSVCFYLYRFVPTITVNYVRPPREIYSPTWAFKQKKTNGKTHCFLFKKTNHTVSKWILSIARQMFVSRRNIMDIMESAVE